MEIKRQGWCKHMLDYTQWIYRAEIFVSGLPEWAGTPHVNNAPPKINVENIELEIAAPLNAQEIANLEDEMSCVFPLRLKQFLSTGSGNCQFFYSLTIAEDSVSEVTRLVGPSIIGEANLCNSSEMPQYQAMCRISAEDFDWIYKIEGEQEIWMNALPFIYMRNGDYLALDLTKDQEDPPVIYLGPTDGHFVVSPNFDEFLKHWEGICYLGPESWIIGEFFDTTDHLNAATEKARAVRRFFGVNDWSPNTR